MNYVKMPSRGKITSDGEWAKDCGCGGKAYVFYDEDATYNVECENCGTVLRLITSSLDGAIKFWNNTLEVGGN